MAYRKKTILFYFCLLLLNAGLYGQETSFSRPQKIAGKVSDYEVIGQTDAGLLVHKWGERYHAIEAYDMNNLSLKHNRILQQKKLRKKSTRK